MKIIFTGGGTAGHVLPLIAITREVRRLYTGKDLRFFYLGPTDRFATPLLAQEGVRIRSIAAGKLRRYWKITSVLENILDILVKLPAGFFQSLFILFFLTPDLVLSKGGYGAVPCTIAAWVLRIPIFLHESDAVAGLANRILSKFSLVSFVSFPSTISFAPRKTLLVGNPIRKEMLTGSVQEAQHTFGLHGDRPLLLIVGGSQGAQRLNDMLLQILDQALESFEIVHQTGERNFEQMKAEAKVVADPNKEKYYHPASFLKEVDLRHLYAAADLIVSRAGAGAIFEIAALGKPSILIPLPEAAQNHQLKNAYEYARTGAAIVLESRNLMPHFFLEKVKYLLNNPKELEGMSQAAKSFAKPEAAKIIASYIIEYLQQ